MTLIPDYLGICPRPMSLSRVEKLLGGTKEEEKEREYLTHAEFISDMRLIFANAIAYNNPDRVVEEVDRVSQSASDCCGTAIKTVAYATAALCAVPLWVCCFLCMQDSFSRFSSPCSCMFFFFSLKKEKKTISFKNNFFLSIDVATVSVHVFCNCVCPQLLQCLFLLFLFSIPTFFTVTCWLVSPFQWDPPTLWNMLC